MMKDHSKLIHDMNSGLGSLGQAMELLVDKEMRSNDLVDKIMIENKLDNNNNTSYHSININEVKKLIEDI